MSDNTLPDSKPVQILSNRQYDALKWVALVGLPALGALYFGLAGIWHFPKAEEVVGTVTLVDTCLGLLLGLAKKNYVNSGAAFDGTLNVDARDNRLIHQLDIQTPPEDLGKKDAITLKVEQVQPE